MGICCMAQETQTGTLYQPRGVGWGRRWEGGSKGRGYMYTYGWLLLMFDRKQQNSVKQLSFNKKINWIKKNNNPVPPTGLILKVPDKIMGKMHTALVRYCYSSVVSQTQWTWTAICYYDDPLGHGAAVSQLVSYVLISSVYFPASLDQQGGQNLHFSGSRAWAETWKTS